MDIRDFPFSVSEYSTFGGTTTGRKTNKVETFGNRMVDIPGTDIKVPEGTACAISLTLDHFEEVGDHYLYICRVDAVYQDKGRKALFAFDGYSKIKTAE